MALVARTHPVYQTWQPVWTKLGHVYEGSGGFLDGTYLVPHPREWQDHTATKPRVPTKKLVARRELARYENVGATLLDQMRSALFRGSITRTIGEFEDTTAEHPLAEWWENVDAIGTHIADYMQRTWTACGLFGHVAHVMDRPVVSVAPETAADAPGPYLRTYTPLDLADWLTDEYGRLLAVLLLEAEPRTDFTTPVQLTKVRQRILTATTWQLVSSDGTASEAEAHTFGTLPVVLQYAKRRALSTVIGQSVLNDPKLYIDLYNLTSEIRELLRLQTFGLLNVQLGTGDQATSVETAKLMIGSETGAENVAFTPGAMNYVQPDTANVEVYQAEREKLLRTIYRLACVPWESDSKDAEATGSLKLKREDLNQVLAGYADECEAAEYQIAKLWFRATYGDSWQREWDAADVVIRYPDTFDVTPFAEVLEQAQAAVAIEMPPAFMRELRRRLVDKFLPDASQEVINAIDKELEQMAKEAAAQPKTPADIATRVKGLMQQMGVPDTGTGAAA